MGTLTVPGVLESLGSVAKYVMDAAAEAGLRKAAAYKLRLAVDEVVTNIIVHGYAESGLSGDIAINAELSDRQLKLLVEDSAVPFDPRQLQMPIDLDKPLEERDIGGLGVFLVFENVDEFDYEHDGQHNRNIFIVNRDTADAPGGDGGT